MYLDAKLLVKIDSQGFESSFEFTFVWPQDDADFFDNIDDVMDDLENLNEMKKEIIKQTKS